MTQRLPILIIASYSTLVSAMLYYSKDKTISLKMRELLTLIS